MKTIIKAFFVMALFLLQFQLLPSAANKQNSTKFPPAHKRLQSKLPSHKEARASNPKKHQSKPAALKLPVIKTSASQSAHSGNKKIKAAIISQSFEELAVIHAVKHFKLSVLLFKGEMAKERDKTAIKDFSFLLKVIENTPIEVFVDTLQNGLMKQYHFENELQKHCDEEIDRCKECKETMDQDCKKFKEGFEKRRLELHHQLSLNGKLQLALRACGIEDNATILRSWLQDKNHTDFIRLLAKNKEVKTLGDLLAIV